MSAKDVDCRDKYERKIKQLEEQALNASQTGVEESAVDELKRYRSEYAEQGNEDVKEPIKEDK
jgi:hypothetical protein